MPSLHRPARRGSLPCELTGQSSRHEVEVVVIVQDGGVVLERRRRDQQVRHRTSVLPDFGQLVLDVEGSCRHCGRVVAMATWFTADLHLGHHNIVSYCDRPFESVAAMNRALVDRWTEVVGDDDTDHRHREHQGSPLPLPLPG